MVKRFPLFLTLIFIPTAISSLQGPSWSETPPIVWSDPSDAFLKSAIEEKGLLLVDPDSTPTLEFAQPLLRKARSLMGPEFYEAGKKEAVEIKEEALAKVLEFLESSPKTLRVDLRSKSGPLAEIGTLNLIGDKGCLALRVDSGTAEVRAVHRLFPMALQGDRGVMEVEVSATGVTWIILEITEAPKGQSYFLLQIDRPEMDPVRLPVRIESAAPGRLKAAVYDESTGSPVPFMVSLRWGADGSSRRPPNAVDLEARFEKHGQSSSLRKARLAGDLDGDYWCVPGPFDMTLPPGDWTIVVRKGLEYVPVVETFRVDPGSTVAKEYTLRHWANMAGKGWWSGDDHVHLRMTSDADAETALTWAMAEGIRLSNILEMGDIARTHFNQRGFGKDFRVEKDGYFLVPGEEEPRTHHELGHTIRLNNQSMVRFPEQYFLYDVYYDAVRDQGGLSGFAHVNSGIFHITRSMTLNAPKGHFDFVEVFQFENLGTQLLYEFLNLGFPMVLSAGSDVPWGGTVGEQRVYVFLGDKPFNPDNWFEEFKNGRTFVTNGPMVEFTVSDTLPGDSLSFSGTGEFKVKASAMGGRGRFLPTRLDLIRQGEVIASATNTSGNEETLSLELDHTESESCWIAVRAQGDDGSIAHSTPIYLVRDSLRFWKYDQAVNLIQRRFEDLWEIEEFVEEAAAKIENGEDLFNLNSWQYTALNTRTIANNRAQLLERVQEARAFYNRLLEVHEEERNLRESTAR